MYGKSLTKKEQTKMERAYEQEKDLISILHQIESDLKEENHQSLYRSNWGIPYKQNVWINLKTASKLDGTVCVRLQVDELVGGYRIPQESPSVLQSRQKDTKELLEKFEKGLRSEFKDRTGKALKLSKPDVKVYYELIATNGLYRFCAIKVATVTTELDGQTWPENEKERKKMELDDE